jgi:hypothetical protein
VATPAGGAGCRLVRFNVDTGAAETLASGDWKVPAASKTVTPSGLPWTEGSVDDTHYVIGLWNVGVLVFPLDGGPARLLVKTSGLPSNLVHAAAVCDGKVYAWVGDFASEGYLAQVDLATGATDILVSSRRQDKRSPLDDAPPMVALFMKADPTRHRVLLSLFRSPLAIDRPSMDGGRWAQSGLWQAVTKTGAVSRVIEKPGQVTAGALFGPDHLFLNLGGRLADLDLTSDALKTYDYDNFAGSTFTGAPRSATMFVLGGYAWYSATAERKAIDLSAAKECLASPRDGKVKPEESPRWPLQPVNEDGRVLLDDGDGLFIVKFAPGKYPEKSTDKHGPGGGFK